MRSTTARTAAALVSSDKPNHLRDYCMAEAKAAFPTGLDNWLLRLSERDMPILSNTVAYFGNAVFDHHSSAGDLASVVLRDAAMTSSVLKVANSAYYNRSGREINTISRAVILLGFDTVRSIGLSLAVIDTFLCGKPKAQVIEIMRQGLTAAVHAKMIAQHSADSAPEEIFIAALLYRVGEMAFWSFARPAEIEALNKAMAAGDSSKQAEIAVLGCTLHELSAGLARHWCLGEVLETSLQSSTERPNARAAGVLLGHELEAAGRQRDLGSPAMRRIIERIAAHTRTSAEQVRAFIARSQQELGKVIETFGVQRVFTESVTN